VLFLPSAHSVVAQDFCQDLADYDRDVDGTDASMFKSHFGRSQFQNPCPPDGPAPVAITGHMTSYFTGDDGYYAKGVAPLGDRFNDNDDGTVTDNLTGLIWMQNASLFDAGSWIEAMEHVQLYNGDTGDLYRDWRVPNATHTAKNLRFIYPNKKLNIELECRG
jgi:hypothetical protein